MLGNYSGTASMQICAHVFHHRLRQKSKKNTKVPPFGKNAKKIVTVSGTVANTIPYHDLIGHNLFSPTRKICIFVTHQWYVWPNATLQLSMHAMPVRVALFRSRKEKNRSKQVCIHSGDCTFARPRWNKSGVKYPQTGVQPDPPLESTMEFLFAWIMHASAKTPPPCKYITCVNLASWLVVFFSWHKNSK